ncbi:MAG: iron-sulfur cluster assembly scaffold protein [Planctomycetota bacterium]
MTDPYLVHFRDPKNAFELEDADVVASAENPACGDHGRLFLRVREDRIEHASFLCRGCSAAIGTLSLLTEWLPGRRLSELDALTLDDLADVVGPLPSAKKHALRLAKDLLSRAAKA